MITVPAHRVKQFGVEFFQASFSAKDIDRLVKFEVLGYQTGTPRAASAKRRKGKGPRVNWELLEQAHRREPGCVPASRDPEEDQRARRVLPRSARKRGTCRRSRAPSSSLRRSPARVHALPPARIASSGVLQIPAQEGVLRALDGQHRLLALHQMIADGRAEDVQVPAVIFDWPRRPIRWSSSSSPSTRSTRS